MPCKMIILGRRKEAVSHEECVRYLEQEHVPLVKQLPGLQRFTTSVPLDPDEAGYDEMAQLWFETPEDARAAFESEEGQRVLQDAENFVDVEDTVMMTVAEETLQHQALPENL